MPALTYSSRGLSWKNVHQKNFHGCWAEGKSRGLHGLQQASAQPTKLGCTLLSLREPYWATQFSPKQHCTVLSNTSSYWAPLHPTELSWTLLSYSVPSWATLHSNEQHFILMSSAAPFWATQHPLRYAAPYWTTLYPYELLTIPWSTLHPFEPSCTLLSYTLHPLSCAACPKLGYLPFCKFLECRNTGLCGIRLLWYRNELKCQCRTSLVAEKGDLVHNRNAPVPIKMMDTGMQTPAASASMPMPSYDK